MHFTSYGLLIFLEKIEKDAKEWKLGIYLTINSDIRGTDILKIHQHLRGKQ